MRPSDHLAGQGCRACGNARKAQKLRGNTERFIARAVEIHGNRYNYSLTKYGKTNWEKVVIICKRHKPPILFEQRPKCHIICGILLTGLKLRREFRR
jgi:hypothetical protein